MNRFLLSIFFFLVYFSSAAQSPTLAINPSQELCANTPLKIKSFVSGLFDQDNVFKIRIRTGIQSQIIELPADFKDDLFEVTIPADRVKLGERYEMQVTSSAPAVVSKWSYSFTIHGKGELIIPEPTADTVNRYRNFEFRILGKSSSSGIVVLSDGSQYGFNSGSYNSEMATSLTVQRYPETSGTYTIASASNVCGPMTVSGQAKVHVNPVSIGTTLITPRAPCLGSEITLGFKIDAGTLPENVQYRIRLVQHGAYPEQLSPDRYEIPAVLKDGQLVARIPENIPIKRPTNFKAAVLIPSAGVVGAFESMTFVLYPKPYAEIISENKTINTGESFGIQVQYRGPNPYLIHLSDGSMINGSEPVRDSMLGHADVYPRENTEYFIRSIQTTCTTEIVSMKKVTATVIPGMAITLPDTVTRYCEGTKVRIPFSLTATVSESTIYSARFSYFSDVQTVPAVRIGEEIEFTIPYFKENFPTPHQREKMFSLQLVAKNPDMVSNQVRQLTILGKPDARWRVNPILLKEPGFSVESVALTGGGPISVIYDASPTGIYQEYTQSTSIGILASQSDEYGYSSLSNSCFVNDNPTKLRVSIANPSVAVPVLSPIAVRQRICEGDSAEIDIRIIGNFAADNEFKVMVSSSECCNYQTARSVTDGGRVRIFLPYDDDRDYQDRTTYFVKVASTNPQIISRSVELSVDRPARNFSVQTPPRSHLMDIIPEVTIKHDGGPIYAYTYSDGTVDYNVQPALQTGNTRFIPKVKPGGNSFQIKSVTSACGKQHINLPFTILIDNYRIRLPSELSHTRFCVGSTMTVPFYILNGETSDKRFFLQLSADNQVYTTVAEAGDDHIFQFKIPASQPVGNYRLRVMSSEGVASKYTEFSIGSPPSATMTVRDQQGNGPFEYRAGERVYADIQLQGSMPQWLSTSNDAHFEVHNSTFFTSFDAVKGGTFAIRSLVNACGPGSGQGSFVYKVKPGLQIYMDPEPHCRQSGPVVNYNLRGDADLSDDYIRFALVNPLTQQVTILDSTQVLSGSLRLKLAPNQNLGVYQLQVFVKKYGLSEKVTFELLDRPVVSLRSNTTINPGGRTNLSVRSENGPNGQDVKFTLSNGYTGLFSPRLEKDGMVTVSPAATTVFRIASVSNVCGTGTVVGASATVTVNPPSLKTIEVVRWRSTQNISSFCAGDQITVVFDTTGIFSSENRFEVQLSDSTGRNFLSIPTTGDSLTVIATLPSGLAPTAGYRLRVVASDVGVASADFAASFVVRTKPTVRFETQHIDFDGNIIPKAAIALTGEMPILTVYSTETESFQRMSMVAVDTLLLYAPAYGRVYTITRVSNECGVGLIDTPSSVTIGLVTAVQNEPPIQGIAFPNPTRDFITIKPGKPGIHVLRLYDVSGRFLDSFSTNKDEIVLDLRSYPTSLLLLNVESGNRKSVFRILRQ